MAHLNLNPQTDLEKLQLLVEGDNPPTNLTLLRRWMSEATLPILKKYLNEFIFQQETGTTISIETYNEAKAEIAGMQFESGGTVGSVKDYWASIDLSKLPEAAQSFIKEQLMNPPAGFSSENETFMELQGIINNYLQKQQEPVPEAIPFSEIPNQLEIKDPVEGQVLYADVNDKDVIRKQVIQAAKQAQKLVKKPLFVFEIPDGELTQIFFTSDGKHSPAEFIAMALPWVDKVYQDEHEEDEHEDITVLKNELQVLKSALPFVRGKDLKEIKSKIKSINSALEIIAPNQKFANGGRLDSKSFDITIGGFNYMGNYHWEGNEIIIDDCEREDPDLVEVQADYTFVPVNDEKTLQAVIEKLEVDKADEKMDEAEAAWEARYSMAADAYGFKKGGKVAIDEMSVLNRMSLGMIAEYSEKLSKIVTADLPAWALAKISKAEAMVAAIKHRLEAENPTLFAKGGELSNGEYAEIQLKHIHHYSKKMLNVLPEIKLEAWMCTNLFLAADYLDSIYHYLDKSKMAKGGGMGKIITFKDGFKFREVSYEYAKANWQKLNIYIVREDEQSESLVENEGDLNEDATYGIEIGFEKGGQVEAARIYAFLQDDLPKLSEAIRAGNNEEVERLFSYWNQHLPNLKTKKYNERMYNFLEDDLRKLYEAVGEGNMEEVERFFSYWGTHLKALDPKGGFEKGGNSIKKAELAQWLVNQNDDFGKDTYFTEDRRAAMTTEESFKKFMKDYTKDGLISIIYDFSNEGQQFLVENGLADA